MKTILCLGDSYTIGEGVAIHESFPYQLVQLLRKNKISVAAPEIVAKTGWTTDELADAISTTLLPSNFDIVTLLIGVNNQYRNRSVEEYGEQFESLLKTAIKFSSKKAAGVFVLSIPDWGVTPFAEGRDAKQIEMEIDHFNNANFAISKKYNCNYIEITKGTRKAESDLSLIAPDKLHYSAKEHERWVTLLSRPVLNFLSNS